MNVTASISVLETSAVTELAGAVDGAAWQQLVRTTIDGMAPGLCAVDFQSIRIATVSWLREGFLGLRKYAEAMRSDVGLIAVNVSDVVREELAMTMEATGNVLIVADMDVHRQLSHPVVLGRLDSALHQTLMAILECRELDAAFVTKQLPFVGLSAANNRLAALETKGLLRSERRGRTRVYRPAVEGLRYGH